MTLQKGWINRQFARVEKDARNWPSWMRDTAERRARHSPGPLDGEAARATDDGSSQPERHMAASASTPPASE
jgi:hypothetical protein